MGPLATYCGEVHDIQFNLSQGKISGNTLTTLLDQSVLLSGQVNNALNFQGILITESALHHDKSKANPLFKKNNDIFKASSKKIYGTKFEKLLQRKFKVMKNSKSISLEFKKNKPFREDIFIAFSKEV